jgi:hypothetical protein
MTNFNIAFATFLATIAAFLGGCGGQESSGSTTNMGSTGGAGNGTGGAAGSGTDGSAGTGGTGGNGGNATCTKATVTFQMIAWRPDGGTPADYCAGMGCGGQWLSIKTAAGEQLDRSFLCGVKCDGCLPVPCPPIACFLPQHLPAEGTTETWDGTYFASETCGAGMQCKQPTCVAASSHLVATMCAYPSVGPDSGFDCMGSSTPSCVDVPFDYPSPGPVVGTIYPVR